MKITATHHPKVKKHIFWPGFAQRGTHQCPGRSHSHQHHSHTRIYVRRFPSAVLQREAQCA